MTQAEVVMSNMQSLTVDALVETLGNAYSTVVNKNLPVATVPSVMLWGPPGVGKSQAVRQIAEHVERATGKRTCVTDVRLLLFNPIDLRGIPTANEDKTLAVWLKPQIFQMDESNECVNILFLDEISAAPQSVQAAAYQITLDRTVGEHRLPDNCIVVAAGNRVTDKSVAFKMPKALANRLMHFEVKGSFEAWRAWAVRSGINEKVVGFLSFKPDRLMAFDTASEDLAFATPRSWEMASRLLNSLDAHAEDVLPMIAGLVGVGVAMEFRTWLHIYETMPTMEEIFDGRMPEVPENNDALFALVSSMTAYAREHRSQTKRIGNSILYAQYLPPDYSAVLMKDYLYLEPGYRDKLMKMPEFSAWLNYVGSRVNGIV